MIPNLLTAVERIAGHSRCPFPVDIIRADKQAIWLPFSAPDTACALVLALSYIRKKALNLMMHVLSCLLYLLWVIKLVL